MDAHLYVKAINVTHRIDRLSFGPNYPGLVNPLDKTMQLINDSTFYDCQSKMQDADLFKAFTNVHYYLDVVPTQYKDHHDRQLATYQFGVTSHTKAWAEEKDAKIPPGVWFKSDFFFKRHFTKLMLIDMLQI